MGLDLGHNIRIMKKKMEATRFQCGIYWGSDRE